MIYLYSVLWRLPAGEVNQAVAYLIGNNSGCAVSLKSELSAVDCAESTCMLLTLISQRSAASSCGPVSIIKILTIWCCVIVANEFDACDVVQLSLRRVGAKTQPRYPARQGEPLPATWRRRSSGIVNVQWSTRASYDASQSTAVYERWFKSNRVSHCTDDG